MGAIGERSQSNAYPGTCERNDGPRDFLAVHLPWSTPDCPGIGVLPL